MPLAISPDDAWIWEFDATHYRTIVIEGYRRLQDDPNEHSEELKRRHCRTRAVAAFMAAVSAVVYYKSL